MFRNTYLKLAMFIFSPGCRNQTTNSFKIPRQFQIAALRVFLNKALQSLKENPEDCEFYNLAIFYRFYLHLYKLFSSQLNDEIDSNSLKKILLLQLINSDNSLNTFNDQNDTDAKKLRKGTTNVFTQIEVDTSFEMQFSPKHGYFRNPEKLLNRLAIFYSSLKIDAVAQYSSVEIDTLHVNYAHSDHLSSYISTLPRQDLSAVMTKLTHDPI